MAATTTAGIGVEALRRCVLFRLADDAMLELCARELQVRRFRRGETIFHQGDPGDALHVIVDGGVKIVLASPTGAEPAILVTLGPGEFFGELAVVDGQPHSASAVALEPTQTVVLRRAALYRLLDADPAFSRALLASLSGELRRLTDHVEALHFLDLAGRLVHRLAQIAEQAAPGQRHDVRLDWPFTQSELAGMIGGSRASVNRLLGDLVADGTVRLEREQLVIPDLDRLLAAAPQ